MGWGSSLEGRMSLPVTHPRLRHRPRAGLRRGFRSPGTWRWQPSGSGRSAMDSSTRRFGVPRSPLELQPVALPLLLLILVLAGCGKDSCLTGPEAIVTAVDFGEGIEVVTPGGTLVRRFDDFAPVEFRGRPAIPLQDLIGVDAVDHPNLYGYRFIGTDGFYPNQKGKGYGDNTWEQLRLGHLDLTEVRVLFETEQDPNLRKGHNVKWLIRVEVLRSIDVVWSDGRKLAAVGEIDRVTVPGGYPKAGADALTLAGLVTNAGPADLEPDRFLYRVSSWQGTSLPRLLTWEEMGTTYFVPEGDLVVMPEVLGTAYQISQPKTIRLERTMR